ncbi:hypothetical protein [Bradyrhizobium sp.]|uniref:hypothetical protein n=1 Tax=Bradyrhizobium sp. TaxID=376 RepID=UPI0025C6B432|nr:hypothetical protein [Bradyrhizobium sp.]
MTKHPKQPRPTDVDLVRNPLIGASKGMTMAQASPDDLADVEGENTIEGDVENDTNAQGGIDKAEARNRRDGPPAKDRDPPPRHRVLQGRKTHEQQLRMLERKPDVPDERQIAEEIARDRRDGGARLPRNPKARQSEFPVSRGGLNQESRHNKHNKPQT